jgi:amidophosphoribosyltransferase
MSDQIKHECGIAMVRLRKPLDFYHQKYGTALYGLNKMYLLLQKQHNRGQDGAGLVSLKIDAPAGGHAIHRERSSDKQALRQIFDKIFKGFEAHKANLHDAEYLKTHVPFAGEILLGHLRYGTFGGNTVNNCHPFLRPNNWRSRYLALAGNFNMTNVDELFAHLIELGQQPAEMTDTETVLERMGHFLDKEVERLFRKYKPEKQKDKYGNVIEPDEDGDRQRYSNAKISSFIADELDTLEVLHNAAKRFDGGYVIGGIIGSGDAFVMRDPNGIRPAYYYYDDEIVVVASERPAIQTALNVRYTEVKELKPGCALIMKRNGEVSEREFITPAVRTACSFERIYFSRGSDRDIYAERKMLGFQLAKPILEAVDYDFENTVFSFVPNTAETAYRGLVSGVETEFNQIKIRQMKALNGHLTDSDIERILNQRPRFESIAVKDVKLRTFITQDASRAELVSHVYDVTYGVVQDFKDTLVLLDDSIVRGTTLRQSILKIVSRLNPKKIIVVSSAPQIRYPDCYGIDMSKMGEFVAFQALVALLADTEQTHLLQETYERCKADALLPKDKQSNQVKALYALFSVSEISKKIAEIIKADDITTEIEVLYQSLENLHIACPDNLGDWYFSGNYPTPGGNKVVNRAFMNFVDKSSVRAY